MSAVLPTPILGDAAGVVSKTCSLMGLTGIGADLPKTALKPLDVLPMPPALMLTGRVGSVLLISALHVVSCCCFKLRLNLSRKYRGWRLLPVPLAYTCSVSAETVRAVLRVHTKSVIVTFVP